MEIIGEHIGQKFNRHWLFKDIDFNILLGEKMLLRGSNGSGKSTLLKTISGQLDPTKGNVRFEVNGSSVAFEHWHLHYSIVSPMVEIWDDLTAAQVFSVYQNLNHSFSIGSNDFFEACYLSEHQQKQVKYFSSGMKQRLKLGLAFYTEKDVLLLDEPCSNLDVEGVKWFHTLVHNKLHGRTLVISSNDTQEYEGISFNHEITL